MEGDFNDFQTNGGAEKFTTALATNLEIETT
jgi:hypothetical protein